MSVSQQLDPQVAEGMDFEDEEEENTSEEAIGMQALAEFDDDMDGGFDDMGLDEDDDDEEDLVFAAPAPAPAPPKKVKSKPKASGEKRKRESTSEKGDKPKKPVFPAELKDAFNQLVEPLTFKALFENVEGAREIINGGILEVDMTEEQKRFSDKYDKYMARSKSAILTIEQYMKPMIATVMEKIAKNEPFAEVVGRIVADEYERMAFKNPPKPKKGRKIRDIYTAEVLDAPKSNKEQRYLFLRVKDEDTYHGYYMDVQGADIIQLVSMFKFFYIYLHRAVQDTFTEEHRKAATIDQSWKDLYSNITQEMSEKPVHKWTKKKGVVQTGSFVDTIIKAKRLLMALAEK